MSVIGPRPQLVRDMVFMTPEQRMRHTAKPGLSGLAQVNGRNAISWEDKLEWDLGCLMECDFYSGSIVYVKRDYTLNSNTKSKIISGFLHFRSMHRIEILM